MRFCTRLDSIGAAFGKTKWLLDCFILTQSDEHTKFDKEVNLAEEWFAVLGYLPFLKNNLEDKDGIQN
jgi:hypothetical protein